MSLVRGLSRFAVLGMLLFAVAVYAQPTVESASYDEDTNILEVTFSGPVKNLQGTVGFTELAFDDDNGGPREDYTLRGGEVINPSARSSTVQIRPVFSAVIDVYTDGAITRRCWGTDYADIVAIESSLTHDNLSVIIDKGAFVNANNVPTPATTVAVEYIETAVADRLILNNVAYSALTNELSFTFNRDVQFDMIAEDLAGKDDTTLFSIPGDGILNLMPAEDRNSNETLDMEANVHLDYITFSDPSGSESFLAVDMMKTLEDASTLTFVLTRSDRATMERLDLESTTVTVSSYAFVDVDYNSVYPVQGLELTYVPDDNPLSAVSAEYDMGTNDLEIVFSQKLAADITKYIILPKIGIGVAGDTSYYLLGGSPTLVQASTGIKVNLLPSDAEIIEDTIDADEDGQPDAGSDFEVSVAALTVLSELGNGNVAGALDLVITGESGSKGAPLLSQATYDAHTNIMNLEFDRRISVDANLDGITVHFGENSYLLTGGHYIRTDARLGIDVYLSLTDQVLFEGESSANKDAFAVTFAPYTVSDTKDNGNRTISQATATYSADTNLPLPAYVWYDFKDGRMVVGASQPIPATGVDLTKLTYQGITLSSPDSAVGDDRGRVICYLNDADDDALAGIANNQKSDPAIDCAAGFIVNGDGTESAAAADLTDFDEVTNGVDTVSLLVGYGRAFWVHSQEVFPTLPKFTESSIRAVSDHAYWFVANGQWAGTDYFILDELEEPFNQGNPSLTPEELAACVAFLEDATPGDTTSGANEQIAELLGGDVATRIPERINILFANVLDNYNFPAGGDENVDFWTPGHFNINDLLTADRTTALTNETEMITIDCHPQNFVSGDTTFYYDWAETVPEWAEVGNGGDDSNYGLNALAFIFGQYAGYKIDPYEERWVREGLAIMCEFLLMDEILPEFWGSGAPSSPIPPQNSLTFIGDITASRVDWEHLFFFFTYLWEKYGGEDILTEISTSTYIGIEGIEATLESRQDDLPEWLQGKEFIDVFLDFATANLIDASIGDEIDHGIYSIETIDLGVGRKGFPLEWSNSRPPPYSFPIDGMSFYYIYTFYDQYHLNLMLDPVNDNLYLYGGERAEGMKFRKVNTPTAPGDTSLFDIQEIVLDERNAGSVGASNSETGWTFGSWDDPQEGQFTVFHVIAVGPGQYQITNDPFEDPVIGMFAAPNAAYARKLDLYVISETPLFNEDNEAVPIVYATSDAAGTDTLIVRNTLDDYIVTVTETVSGEANQYLNSSWITTPGTYYWHLGGFFANGDPVETITIPVDVQKLPAGRAGMLSIGESFILRTTGASLSQESWAAVSAVNPDQASLVLGKHHSVSKASERNPVSKMFIMSAPEFEDPYMLTMQYDIAAAADQPVGIYFLYNGDWAYIGGAVDKSNGTITVSFDRDGSFQVMAGKLGTIPSELLIPTAYALNQNYPNPFNPSTTVSFRLPHSGHVSLVIYDLLGREVARLVDTSMRYGIHSVGWNGKSDQGTLLSSGVYFIRMKADGFADVKKMVLVK